MVHVASCHASGACRHSRAGNMMGAGGEKRLAGAKVLSVAGSSVKVKTNAYGSVERFKLRARLVTGRHRQTSGIDYGRDVYAPVSKYATVASLVCSCCTYRLGFMCSAPYLHCILGWHWMEGIHVSGPRIRQR